MAEHPFGELDEHPGTNREQSAGAVSGGAGLPLPTNRPNKTGLIARMVL